MNKDLQLGIILNPEAGRGRAKSALKHLLKSLEMKRISYQLEKTMAAGHAKDIALRMKNKFKIILAAGGDGTVNEVTCGIIDGKSALAILPIGSGNDFNKIIGIPKRIDNALDAILSGKTRLFDFGKISFRNSSGQKKVGHFINTLGIGLDAEIAQETRRIKKLRGLPLYLWAAVKALYKHSPNDYKLRDKNKTWVEKAFLICIGNGQFEGGGFRLLPEAMPDDSCLDICLIRNMPIFKALKLVPQLIKGTHTSKNNISVWRSKKIRIESEIPFIIHGDGEILTDNAVKVDVELTGKKIKIVIP